MKRCFKCKETKPREAFHRNGASKDGLQAACSACSARYGEARRRRRGVPVRKRVDSASGTFQCSKCIRTLPLSCFHVRRQRGNQPRSTCKECVMASTREWASTERGRAWRADYQRSKMHTNPAYYEAQRSLIDRNNARRRGAREVGESFTRQEIYERDKGRCHLCGKRARKDDWDLEHVIPLSKGGTHTRSNVAVSHPACNGQKSTQITHLF